MLMSGLDFGAFAFWESGSGNTSIEVWVMVYFITVWIITMDSVKKKGYEFATIKY